MGQALYRKYRSKALSEIVGQDHITTTLAQAIKAGTLAHAYLFTGPRGTGKTSIARILAHQINDLPYTDESIHLDIIEIDAASNRRIDEIRELRDKIHIAPTSAKYKVYIIDEVHMLTKEAFNALLKTLEEPPAHVIFILATTELHKVPDTIVSRTQRFAFKPVEQARVVAHLRSIAESENIDIDDAALALVADHGGGSFRDSISLLDQLRNSPDSPVTADTVRLVLGVPKAEATALLLQTIMENQPAAVLHQIQSLSEQGFAAPQIAAQLYDAAKAQLLDGKSAADRLLTLMQDLLGVAGASDTYLKLELVALQAATAQLVAAQAPVQPIAQAQATQQAAASSPIQSVSAPLTAAAPPIKTSPKQPAAATSIADTVAEPNNTPTKTPPSTMPVVPPADTVQDNQDTSPVQNSGEESAATQSSSDQIAGAFDLKQWPSVLMEAKNHNNTLYGVLRMAHPSLDGNKLILAFAFPFHQKRINDSKHKAFITDAIVRLTGQTVSIEVIVDKTKSAQPYESGSAPIDDTPPPMAPPADYAPAPSVTPAPVTSTPGDLKSVMDVFGGGEVL